VDGRGGDAAHGYTRAAAQVVVALEARGVQQAADGAAAEAAVGGPAAAPELLGAVRAQRLTRRQHLRRGEAAHGDAASCVGAAPGVWQACPPAAALGRRAVSRAPATNTPASTRRPTTPPSRARRSATKLIAASATLVVSAKVAIARA